MEFGYQGQVRDHYENPSNAGSFPRGADSGTGMAGSPTSAVVRFQVQIEDGIVVDARFKAHGCGYTIAAASYASEWIKGRTVEEAAHLAHDRLAAALEMPATKLLSAVLVEDALKAALQDYAARNDAAPLARRRATP